MQENIVLFDLDGTLTPPRESMPNFIEDKLKKLSEVATVGIVTGSDIAYIYEQVSLNFILNNKIILLPCNGTKFYIDNNKIYDINFEKYLGIKKYYQLMKILIQENYLFSKDLEIPLTGSFIEARGSMINWSPIGRNANIFERSSFIEIDEKLNLRDEAVKKIRKIFKKENLQLSIALGGSTSFDIYPNGWNKTYALNHFDNKKKIWFIGDKCFDNGNDKEIYDEISKSNRAFSTHSLDKTLEIIDEIILKITENK